MCQHVLYVLYNFVSCGVSARGKDGREHTGCRQMRTPQEVGPCSAETELDCILFNLQTERFAIFN